MVEKLIPAEESSYVPLRIIDGFNFIDVPYVNY